MVTPIVPPHPLGKVDAEMTPASNPSKSPVHVLIAFPPRVTTVDAVDHPEHKNHCCVIGPAPVGAAPVPKVGSGTGGVTSGPSSLGPGHALGTGVE